MVVCVLTDVVLKSSLNARRVHPDGNVVVDAGLGLVVLQLEGKLHSCPVANRLEVSKLLMEGPQTRKLCMNAVVTHVLSKRGHHTCLAVETQDLSFRVEAQTKNYARIAKQTLVIAL